MKYVITMSFITAILGFTIGMATELQQPDPPFWDVAAWTIGFSWIGAFFGAFVWGAMIEGDK